MLALPIAEVLKTQPWDTLLALGVFISLALVPLAIKIGTLYEEHRTRALRAAFGDEYDQAVDHHGDRRRAEAALVARARLEQKRTPLVPHGIMLLGEVIAGAFAAAVLATMAGVIAAFMHFFRTPGDEPKGGRQ